MNYLYGNYVRVSVNLRTKFNEIEQIELHNVVGLVIKLSF